MAALRHSNTAAISGKFGELLSRLCENMQAFAANRVEVPRSAHPQYMPFPPDRLLGWTAGRSEHLFVKYAEEAEQFKACPEYEPTEQKLWACIQAEVAGLVTRNDDENILKFARLTQELLASTQLSHTRSLGHGDSADSQPTPADH